MSAQAQARTRAAGRRSGPPRPSASAAEDRAPAADAARVRVVASCVLGRDRAPVRRQGGAGDLAPAAPRGHHPPAGGRQGPGPVADRGRDLRRVALPRPDLARGRQGADADPALDGGLHRAQVGRHGVRGGRPRDPADQHRLRLVVPALPAASTTTATSCWRSPPTTRARARSTSGTARRPRAARTSRWRRTSRSPRPAATWARCSRCAAATARNTGRELGLDA